jgi:gliding motility-associated-like protein
LDGDGDADVLSASQADDKIAWYENLGGGSFSGQNSITTSANSAYSVFSIDLDGDGDADVLSASIIDNKIAWYENLIGFNITVAILNLPCVGSANGSIQIATSGPRQAPFTYSWVLNDGADNGNGVSNNDVFTIDNLAEGSYDILVIDANGDSAIVENFVLSSQLGSYFEIVDITVTNSSNGFNNGAISVSIDGGNPNYIYSWSGPSSGNQNTSATTFLISGIPAGTYTITVTESGGASSSYTVTLLDETVPQSTCQDGLDVVILNDVSGSVDGTEYSESKQFFVDFINALNIGTSNNDANVAVIEWASTGQQNVKIPLTGNLTTLQNYNNASRSFSGGTNSQDALTYGKNYLEINGRAGVPKVLVLSTDAAQNQVSGSLIALANQYKAQGYFIVTIAFDDAYSNGFTREILRQVASADGVVYGAPAYSQLNNNIANTIVNVYVCPIDPGSSNTVFFNRDGVLNITGYTVNGFCPNPSSVDIAVTVTAQQQLSLPPGTPITFYYNNPALFGASPIATALIPCAIPAGSSENLVFNLPISNPANVYAVLNDDGSQLPPLTLPVTNIEEYIYLNNIDNISICTNPLPTVSALKYTTTPIPVCDSVVIYNVDVCNINSVSATGVVVTDVPPTGAVLQTTNVNYNGCSSESGSYNIPAGCCVSLTYTYNIANVANGFYNNQDVTLTGPGGQVYINFDGAPTVMEDVEISNVINCVSEVVTFSKAVNVTAICEESFVTFTFTIDNQSNVPIFGLNFTDNLPSPVIWAAEPYLLDGLSIGATNITGSQNANFTIARVEANTTATFYMDAYLGNWTNNGVITNTANLANFPSFVNGNGANLSATAPSVNVYVLPSVDAVNLVQINSDEVALLQSTILNGINPVWTGDGDGTYVNANLEDATYIPGPLDIENGVVHFTIAAESPLATCGQEIDTVRLEITKVYDFGDAPNIYKTLNSANGAKHFLTYTQKNALFLGSNNADDETDGLPVTAGQTATRDDNQNVDDENGVAVFPTLSNDMTGTYSVEVQAQNLLSTNARLLGWIDFNKDGIWVSSESAFLNIAAGTSLQNYTLNFTLPAVLDTGITYARFRIMTDNLSDNGGTPIDERSFGLAGNGEVEDYEVYIVEPVPEICDNGIDDDGDGDIDAADTDCQSCQAQFSPSSFCFGNATNFDGSTSFASPQASITSYYWDFGDGNTSSNPIVDLATNTYSLAGTYDVLLIIEDDSSCVDSITQSITIHPLPNAQISAIANVCLNAAPFTLTQGSPAGGSYFGIGVSSATFNPTIAGVGSHTIFYAYSDVNGCSDTVSTTITVNAIPIVTLAPFAEVCASSQSFTLTGGSPAGGSYSGIGVVGNSFDPAITESGSFDIHYVFTVNGCSDTASQIIVVNANTVANLAAIPDVCILAGSITLMQGSPAGGSYSGIGVSGNTFDPTIAGLGTHTIFYIYSDGNGCVDTANTSVLVYDISGIAINPIADVCINEAAFVLTQGSPGGGTYQGIGVTNDSIFNPTIAGVGSHPIQYIFNNGNGCSDTATTTITINAIPIVTLAPFAELCATSASFTLTGGSPAGGSYSGIGLVGNTFDPVVAGVGSFDIQYVFSANGCSDTATQTIVVNANPVASISAIPDVCILAGNLTLTQGSPAGGSYSGIGVSDNTFDPTVAGVGTNTIFYVYSDGNDCVDTVSTSVLVYDISGITISPVSDVCLNALPFVLTQGSPAGGIYQGIGVTNDSIFNPQTVGVGSHTIEYIFNDGNGCADTVSGTITVLNAPTVTFNPINDICINEGSIALSGVNPSGGIFEGTGVTGNSFDPIIAGEGIFDIEYLYFDVNGCSDSAIQSITVLTPGIDTSEVLICEGASYSLGNGQIITEEGFYPDTLSNTGTCEVIEVTHLIIEAASIDSVYGLVCVGDTYELPNGAFVSQPGMYLDTLAGINNCDSVIVTIIGLDENGCLEECFLTAPTAFTPDNDNMNDVFYIINTCEETLITFELMIYNRWGELIYTSNNISEGWDGKAAGKVAELDVYTYIVNFNRQGEAENERLTGIVLLLR